ncbi:MAG: hypothetical protein N2Z22_07545 [Turneriella sp.]|nr:hypothetical protein [Turneriella sp.]
MWRDLRYKPLRILGILVIVSGVVAFWVFRPLTQTAMDTGGFTPLRDDALAAKFVPRILPHPLYGAPERILYRMARSPQGKIHIAYHPFYSDEENPHPGFGAMLSRVIYTGGLRLKNIIFGPADIELIEVVITAKGEVEEVGYEEAGHYYPHAFSVRHVPKTIKNPKLPLCFATVSWNHMFTLEDPEKCHKTKPLVPEYFSAAEWQKYRMVKNTEAILRRNRMHRVYERIAAD